MAMKRDTMKSQVTEAVTPALQPGDRIVTIVATMTGPNPWLMNGLGLLGQLFVKYYFVVVTEQQLIFVKMSRMSQRPGETAFTAPRQQAQITDFKKGAVWSSIRYTGPGADKPLRLNIHRIWREELDNLAKTFSLTAP